MIPSQAAYKNLFNKQGQTVLEVLLLFPLFLLVTTILFNMNTASQVAINNAQYARAQIFHLMRNSSEYPRLEFRFFSDRMFSRAGQDRMILGVADPDGISGEGVIDPIPQTVNVAMKGAPSGSDARGEVTNRTNIRIRSTASICTPLSRVAGVMIYEQPRAKPNARWPFDQSVCQYQGDSSL